MNTHDTTKQSFLDAWPGGYRETWQGDNLPEFEQMVYKVGILPFVDLWEKALEIGCGRGLWTKKHLAPNFGWVVALDLLPAEQGPSGDNITYIEVPDRDFTCYGTDAFHFGFAFSYGCFPHLSGDAQAEYLRNIFRVLKPGGYATINFADYPKRKSHEKHTDPNLRTTPESPCWFYCSLELATQWAKDAGFVEITDLLPEGYRDTLLGMRKPE